MINGQLGRPWPLQPDFVRDMHGLLQIADDDSLTPGKTIRRRFARAAVRRHCVLYERVVMNLHIPHKQEYVTVSTFDDRPGAEALAAWLSSEGISARVQDETWLQKYWFLCAPKAGVHVQTAAESYEAALKTLARPAARPYLRKADLCPSCGSHRVQYPDFTRKNLLPTLMGQLFVLLRITRHKYYCEDCHFSWPRISRRARRHDPSPTVQLRLFRN
jgi:hypothetical protein